MSKMLCSKFVFRFAKALKQLNLTGTHDNSHFLNSKLLTASYEELILKNTVVSENHLTPELKLRLITPECDVWYCKEAESLFPSDPFWGIYWPGGQSLGRFILDNPEFFKQRTVLDIGSGSGACAIASAKSGAKFVLANDVDPVSLSAVNINSRLNGLKVHTCDENLIGRDIDSLTVNTENGSVQLEWNVILLGDMFYDTEFSCKLFAWLTELVDKNKLVLVGDPGRHVLKDLESMRNFGFMEKIAEYRLLNKEHNGFTKSSVFKVSTIIVCLKAFKVTPVTSHASNHWQLIMVSLNPEDASDEI